MVYDTDLAITPERLDFLRSNSKVRVDKEGRWSMDGRLVEHPRVQRLFHSSVSVGEDGRPVLRVGPQWCYVQFVDDTVFFVERIRRGPDDRLVVVLADGAEEILRPESLTRRGETDVYCRLGNGHRARCAGTAWDCRAAAAVCVLCVWRRNGCNAPPVLANEWVWRRPHYRWLVCVCALR